MIFFILDFLTFFGIRVPAVFTYTSTRSILALVTSLLFVLLLGPKFIKKLYEMKLGQPIRDWSGFLLGVLHKEKKNTPTMGGILIISGILCSLFLWMDLRSPFTLLLFITTCIISFLGGYDDYLKLKHQNEKGLSGKKKLLIQLFSALLIICYLQLPQVSEAIHLGTWWKPPVIKEFIVKQVEGQIKEVKEAKTISLKEFSSRLYIPFFKEPIFIFSGISLAILWLFLAFVIVGASNSVNLTDGLDGLAAGLLVFVSATLGIFAFLSNHQEIAEYLNLVYIEGSGEIAVFLTSLCGACLGFLWYNGHPAEVFMGDIGSLTLGGLVGVSAVILGRGCLLGVIGGIFVVEALSVIVQVASYKYRNKQRIFLCAPLHHHFEYKGWPETKVVIRFWILGFLLSMLGLASIKFQ